MTFEEWWDENEFEWVSRKDMAKAAWDAGKLAEQDSLRELLAQALPYIKADATTLNREAAERMLNGILQTYRPIDCLVTRIEEALK